MTGMLSEEILKLLVAMFLGGLIGMEREIRDKAAGFRTLILICAGACLFTIFSSKIGGNGDPGRIAANVVTGIGFLGAGVIIRDGGQVKGLTTASTIWLVAALGVGVGFGNLIFSIFATIIFLVVLWLFPVLEGAMSVFLDIHTYKIKLLAANKERVHYYRTVWQEYRLRPILLKVMKEDSYIVVQANVTGRPKDQRRLIEDMLSSEEVVEFKY